MRFLLLIASVFLLSGTFIETVNAQSSNVTASVTGTGSSIDEAKSDAIRQALQQTMKQMVVVDRAVSGDRILRDKVMSTMNGYIEKFVVRNEAKTGAVFSVTADVTVAASRIENFIGIVTSAGGALDSSSLLAEQARRRSQIQADLLQRKANGEIFDNVLRAFPSKALSVRTLGIALSEIDPDELKIAIEVSPKPSFVKALEETVKALSAIECVPLERRAGDNLLIRHAAFAFRDEKYCRRGRTLPTNGWTASHQTTVCFGYTKIIQCYGLKPGDYCATCRLEDFSESHLIVPKSLVIFGRFVDLGGHPAASELCLTKLAKPENLFGVYLERNTWRKGKPLEVATFDFASKRAEIGVRSNDAHLSTAKYFVAVGALQGPRLLINFDNRSPRLMTSVLEYQSGPQTRTGCALLDEAVHIRRLEGFDDSVGF